MRAILAYLCAKNFEVTKQTKTTKKCHLYDHPTHNKWTVQYSSDGHYFRIRSNSALDKHEYLPFYTAYMLYRFTLLDIGISKIESVTHCSNNKNSLSVARALSQDAATRGSPNNKEIEQKKRRSEN